MSKVWNLSSNDQLVSSINAALSRFINITGWCQPMHWEAAVVVRLVSASRCPCCQWSFLCPPRPTYAVYFLMWQTTLPVIAVVKGPFPLNCFLGNGFQEQMLPPLPPWQLCFQWWGIHNVNSLNHFVYTVTQWSFCWMLSGLVETWYKYFTHCSQSHATVHKSLPYPVWSLILYLKVL